MGTSPGQGASSSSRSSSPVPIPISSVGRPKISGSRDLPLPPPSATEHMIPPITVPANLSPSRYQPQQSPLAPQPPQRSPLPGKRHVHHASNHSRGGYGDLNLPLVPHRARHSPSTRSRTPSPDIMVYLYNYRARIEADFNTASHDTVTETFCHIFIARNYYTSYSN
jgi:hypothetical protein